MIFFKKKKQVPSIRIIDQPKKGELMLLTIPGATPEEIQEFGRLLQKTRKKDLRWLATNIEVIITKKKK